MINLKNEFSKFKLDFEEYKKSFKEYEKNYKKHLDDLKKLTDRDGEIFTRDRKPTDECISQAEKNIRINQERYSSYEAAITKIDNYMNSSEGGKNLSNAVGFINKLQSIIGLQPQKSVDFPKMDLSSIPLVQHAVLSLYNNDLEMNKKFYDLNGQYLQFSEIANETLQMMNKQDNQNEAKIVDSTAAFKSVDIGLVNSNPLNAFETKTINCEIILGELYC